MLFLLLNLFFNQASASVVLKNTRVIYPARNNEHTIEFTNTETYPSIVQLWVDTGDAKSTPETADNSFVIMPPIFKIDAESSQSVRVMYTGKPLVQDRESIYYMNFLVIPPNLDNENKLSVVLRNRVKLFYRPEHIIGASSDAIKTMTANIHYKKNGEIPSVNIKNESGYFINLSHTSLTLSDKKYLSGPIMIPPFSNLEVEDYSLSNPDAIDPNVAPNQAVLDYAYINDFGAQITGTLVVTKVRDHE